MKEESRLRYTITSDYNDLPKKIEFELNFFLEKTSIDELLTSLIKDLKNRNIDYKELLLELHTARSELAKLDMLLDECSNIFEVCAAPADVPANTDIISPELNLKNPIEPALTDKTSIEALAMAEPGERTEQRMSEINELHDSMNQIRNMAKNLKTMKQEPA